MRIRVEFTEHELGTNSVALRQMPSILRCLFGESYTVFKEIPRFLFGQKLSWSLATEQGD